MRYLFIYCFASLYLPFTVNAQTNHLHDTTIIIVPQIKNDDGVIYTYVEKYPVFPGNIDNYIKQQLHYPADAKSRGIYGDVLVRFTISESGSISDVTVLRSLYPSLDNEAMRIIQHMPRWKPATQKGKPINCPFSIKVNFER